MPGLDGFDVCRRLKTNPETADVPVTFVTALDDSADESQGFAVGAVDYITKPIRRAIVKARVRTHVELKHTRDLFEQLASLDSLTRVANRRRFDTEIGKEWRRTGRKKRWLSLALVDVDEFKPFNDRYGHLAGDQCLRDIAAALAMSARRVGEIIARYGGDEFGLILPDVDPALMRSIGQSLLRDVSAIDLRAVTTPGHATVTVSVGAISVMSARDLDAARVLDSTDKLLYEAKVGGRDRCMHLDFLTGKRTTINRV